MLRPAAHCLTMILVAGAAAADPAALTRDLTALATGGAAPEDSAAAAELAAVMADLGAGPEGARRLPAALAQGAVLARSAAHPASRAVFEDLTRDMLISALAATGRDPAGNAVVAAWTARDPLVAALGTGQGLAASDIAAAQALAARDPGLATVSVRDFWAAQAETPVNRVLPTRLAAWGAGANAAWDDLDAGERRRVLRVLDDPEIPPAPLLHKVIGTDDLVGWLAATDVPMTPAEAAASPDLLHYMHSGAFAGPMAEILTAMDGDAALLGAGSSITAVTEQMMRLNGWSAVHGETHSPDAFRAMTEGR